MEPQIITLPCPCFRRLGTSHRSSCTDLISYRYGNGYHNKKLTEVVLILAGKTKTGRVTIVANLATLGDEFYPNHYPHGLEVGVVSWSDLRSISCSVVIKRQDILTAICDRRNTGKLPK